MTASRPWSGATQGGLDEALAWILGHVVPARSRRVPLADALGLVLAEDVRAMEQGPPFDTSAMDGYAASAAGMASGARFEVVGSSVAGRPYPRGIRAGEAVRIMTGAAVPHGADVVVPLERCTIGANDVVLPPALQAGDNIRRAGSDHQAGEVLVPVGTRLTPAHVAVLASLGHDAPAVVPRPRVGVLSTGDELTAGGDQGATIRDANRPGLLALVAACGWSGIDLGTAPDDPDDLVRHLEAAIPRCDAVLTTGGVSVGDHDHVKGAYRQVASAAGGTSRWWQLALRPAKPLMFASAHGVPLFGLPGNPASAFVSFEVVARPAIGRLAGEHDAGDRHAFTAVAAEPFSRRPDGRVHVVPVVADITADGTVTVHAASPHRHHLAATASATALAYLPDGPTVPAGTAVRCSWMPTGSPLSERSTPISPVSR